VISDQWSVVGGSLGQWVSGSLGRWVGGDVMPFVLKQISERKGE